MHPAPGPPARATAAATGNAAGSSSSRQEQQQHSVVLCGFTPFERIMCGFEPAPFDFKGDILCELLYGCIE
jgi:hypothetical protein